MQTTIKLLIASLACTVLAEGQEASTLDVNADQHSTFMDGEDVIEDLSEDVALDEEETEDIKPDVGNVRPFGGAGNPIASLLGGDMGAGLRGIFEDDP